MVMGGSCIMVVRALGSAPGIIRADQAIGIDPSVVT